RTLDWTIHAVIEAARKVFAAATRSAGLRARRRRAANAAVAARVASCALRSVVGAVVVLARWPHAIRSRRSRARRRQLRLFIRRVACRASPRRRAASRVGGSRRPRYRRNRRVAAIG